jgi:hypothetical protein
LNLGSNQRGYSENETGSNFGWEFYDVETNKYRTNQINYGDIYSEGHQRTVKNAATGQLLPVEATTAHPAYLAAPQGWRVWPVTNSDFGYKGRASLLVNVLKPTSLFLISTCPHSLIGHYETLNRVASSYYIFRLCSVSVTFN